jgi:hypothetical protein
MRYIVIGNIGSDAGYWVWDGKGWHHVGGWGVDRLQEVSAALNIMREASRLKTPGLAEAATQVVSDFLSKELQGHLNEGSGTVILG